MNQFVWDLRVNDAEKVEKDMVLQGSLDGPKVVPGKYFVQLLRGDTLLAERPFDIYEHPKIKVSQEDLAAQYELAIHLRDTITAIHKAVKDIRKIRASVEAFIGSISDTTEANQFKESAKPLTDSLQYIEDALIQTKIKAGEDALRFPIRLNDKLATLFDIVKTADAKPTDQDYDVFHDLCHQVDKQLTVFKMMKNNLVPKFNTLAEHSRKPVINLKD
jgi:hypothetical protein